MDRAALAAGLLVLLLAAPSLAADAAGGGHWDVLGEDGRVWVPDEPPAAAYLPPPDLGSYHNWDELTAALQSLASTRSDVAGLVSLGDSVEGRDVWALTLRAGAEDGRPALLLDGAHHGDEVIASEILLRYAQDLVAGYPSTPRSRAILENVTLVIVPMVNPDGVARAPYATYYADARKNANGVDLNRNYAHNWGGPGSSGSPTDATYRGPTPASEPETRILQQLLASREWSFYSSLHSGAEMILWPYGHTTSPPPENALYQTLGAELTAITGFPNGQVSRILYSVSGDSMDHAYAGPLPGWRPISISPETYEGSGSAFDWWYLFNPADAGIPATVATWAGFLDHLALQAASYAPATLALPPLIESGAAPIALDATVTPSAKRPLLGANLTAMPPAFLAVSTANPVSLGSVASSETASWTLLPASGGLGAIGVSLDMGIAGRRSGSVPVHVIAPAVTLAVDRARAGSGETANATITLATNEDLAGAATLTFGPRTVDARNVTLAAGGALSWVVPIDVADAPAGATSVEVVVDYGGGAIRAGATLAIDRPDLTALHAAPATSLVGDAFLVTVTIRNDGNMPARSIVLTEFVPSGYALAPRDVGVPVPADPLARPAPRRVIVTDDGRLALEWEVLALNPGSSFGYQLKLVAIEPGAHQLETRLAYGAQYPSRTYAYDETALATHATRLP